MAFMTSLLYLCCFFYTLILVIMYHVLCKIYLALQLEFYVMFFLSEILYLFIFLYLNQFREFIKEIIETCSLKLLLIPAIRESPYYHTS